MGELQAITPGGLYLSDLGYLVLARFRTIAERKAYFLSRFDTHTALLTVRGEPLDLLAWLRTHSEPQFEQQVLIGSQERLPWRMVVVRVPQEVADTRCQKAYETARRKGRTPSERHVALMDWSLFITNVPATRLTLRQVVTVYAVRWQVELIFKLWKSECAVDRVRGLQRERVLSELYAKLIGIVVMQFLLAPYRDGERELSVVKVVHIIQHHVPQLLKRLGNLEQLTEALQELAKRFLQHGMKDQRQKRLTTYQQLRALEAALA
jgi:Transposase DDE domain